ncbi:MAG: hypothetical protein JSV96_13195 [Candidatus Aminicenantes bacterium]|nr:MAG: hypothetical protein JSV96_13195 [Candidatus Aminicenantes bacterium]
MNDKPKDRTTMWMSIIALFLVLMIAFVLGVGIHMIVTGYYTTPIVGFLLGSVLLAIVLRWIMREKRNYKPKDRTIIRMSIIALFLVLISGLVKHIEYITGYRDGTGVFSLLCLVLLTIALYWKAVGGVFFVITGLFMAYAGVRDIITGSYETLLEQILIHLVWFGLMPVIVGLLFLAIWRKTRKPEVPTSSD